MDKKIIDFLSKEKICSLTTLLNDGSPHAAAVHFSHQNEPFELYFSTNNTSKKCEALLSGQKGRGSVIVGFSETEWITLQMDGAVSIIINNEELERAQSIHYTKNQGSTKFKDDPATVILKFVPSWWRFTDYNTKPLTIISSEQK